MSGQPGGDMEQEHGRKRFAVVAVGKGFATEEQVDEVVLEIMTYEPWVEK